ncbi:MAG: OmpH family outer membrane protein [Candidatus Omnitrophica bacterium]|jgi:outer membrane protein|nr:OmpH family outer membrane protein [Candidatus Omnitrophota bacterium]
MRRMNMVFLFAFFISCFTYTGIARAADVKIGYIDIAAVFDGYDRTKEEDAKLGTKSQSKQAQRDKMVENVRNMKNEIELLNEKQKEKKQIQIDDEIRKLQDFDREGKAELQRERDDMVKAILKDIESVVNDYAAQNSYTMILNSRVLEYALEEYNITKAVLNLLNSKYRRSAVR